MHSDHTMLITEREPIIYVEHAKVMMCDGKLFIYYADGTKEIVPPISTLLMLLGAGTSISQAAAIYCAQNNLFLCFARGGAYLHSIWQGGRWSPPEKMVRQATLHADDKQRLFYAKKLISLKLAKSCFRDEEIKKIDSIKTINKLLSFEANAAKKTYKDLSLEHQINDFKRIKESKEGVNGRLTLLNNALYGYCTAVVLQFGFHPSVGFVHGKTRRGGLAFDLADIFKYDLCLVPAFSENYNNKKETIINFGNRLKKHRFRMIKEMIFVLRFINGEIDEEEVEKILDEYSNI